MGLIITGLKMLGAIFAFIIVIGIIGALINHTDPAKQQTGSIQSTVSTDQSQITPTAQEAATRDFTISGIGKDVSKPFFLKKGKAVINMDYKGESNFIVKLLDNDANLVSLLANQIGSWNGATAIRVPRDGEYIVDVTATGTWNIRIQN